MNRALKKITTILMMAFMIATTASADTFVIANSISTEKTLSYTEIENVFTLRNKRWENGAPIRVYILPIDNQRTREFTLKFLNMSANRYFDIIQTRESLGKGNVSDILTSEFEVMRKVLTTPGSIGYASDSIIINFSGNIMVVK